MTKRVFIVHRWEGNPEADWYPWLKKQLEEKGFQVEVPAMPDPDSPKIDEWVSFLREKVGDPDENTYFVGHSIGCQTILRYLETVPDTRIGGVVLVAGWINLTSEVTEKPEEYHVAKPWLEAPIEWDKIRNNNFVAVFSDNDPYVPIGDAKIFQEKLGARVVFESRKGHFTEEENVRELLIVLNELLRMA
ncbi:MAG: alpha/beta hydrolase [Candidatus Aenigmatarchaeota archaeon]